MNTDVAIVGAGPYGLSLAAQLVQRGVDHRIFGPPMDSWATQMPADLRLKSDGFASSLCAPVGGWSLGEYCVSQELPYGDFSPRVSLDLFVDYGVAFQREFAPDLDPRMVVGIAPALGGFSLTLEGGEVLTSRRVVLAIGITHFGYVPKEFEGLGENVTHSHGHRNFGQFAGKRVAVVGAGSSATNVAAGLVNAGAHTQLITRRAEVPFQGKPDPDAPPRTRLDRLCNPTTGLGPGMRNKLCQELPDVFRHVPGERRLRAVRGHLGPMSPWWVRDDVEKGAEILTNRTVRAARSDGETVTITTTDAHGTVSDLSVDHVICGTGYWPDLDRVTFLDPTFRQALSRIGTMPELSHGFESSIPGMYFMGISAAGSFGPLLRFVVGAEFAAPRVAAHLSRRTANRRSRPAERAERLRAAA
jgi:thioredoxin reductase